MKPEKLRELLAQSARRRELERTGAVSPPSAPSLDLPEVCSLRGGVIHPSKAPGTVRTYYTCLHPSKPRGEAVCSCLGCGPRCPGYTKGGGAVEEGVEGIVGPVEAPRAVELPVVEKSPGEVRWAYGVTTVPRRRDDLLPRTLASLKAAGFDRPRLFVDGDDDSRSWSREFDLEVTTRYPVVRTHANWVLSLTELYLRDPLADRFGIFQDDLLACRGLREYLSTCAMPERGYWNLYTVPHNQRLAPRTKEGGTVDGWFMSNQLGKGALGLVFGRQAVVALLGSHHMIMRPQDQTVQKNGWYRGQEAVDGGVVTALRKAGWTEWCHSPSLVQHVGDESTMGHVAYPKAESWRGEGWDATSLISM